MGQENLNSEYQQRIDSLENELRQTQLENQRLQMQLLHLAEIKNLMNTISVTGWRRYRYTLFPAGSRRELWFKRLYHFLKNLGR